MSGDFESLARSAAFAYLDARTGHGERPITWPELQNFTFDGVRIPLAGQQGIFRPKRFRYPISIRTAPPRGSREAPYPDEFTDFGVLYRYRGTNRDHHENRWLREAAAGGVPLVYLFGLATGLYDVEGAGIIDDRPEELTFHVALFPIDSTVAGLRSQDAGEASLRHHLAMVKRRIGQGRFRTAVMAAYRTQCAVCRLRRNELLDAAHIVPDYEGGPLVVTNGVALCKIHHAAYDSDLVGIRPDYVAEVKGDLLTERDGPMLRHGLQEIHGRRLTLPRSPTQYPDPHRLEIRYERFRVA